MVYAMASRFRFVKRVGVTSMVALSVLSSPLARAAVDESNKQVATKLAEGLCNTCHGAQGRGDNPRIPRIAGQQRAYIEVQLKAFRGQTRGDPAAHEYMWGIAATLSDDVVAALADYFSSQAPAADTAPVNIQQATIGKRLFEQGSPERGTPACSGCHGVNAEGMAVFPRLAGQHSEYLYLQLKLIQNKLRESPVMHGLIKQLTSDEITAVAGYLQSK
jgi:cytochrome c553